jgi:ubiquinone/menaquinone biosynthesis C-methylase UbiE
VTTAQKERQTAVEGNLGAQLSPMRFFEAMHAYQQTAALKAAIELELFTAIGEGAETVSDLAQRIVAPERGVRALCDFLVIRGFLNKSLGRPAAKYTLTPDSAMFLSKKSPAYLGSATVFLANEFVTDSFRNLTAVVRAGGPVRSNPEVDQELPIWADFARGMAPLAYMVAEQTEKLVHSDSAVKVLDIAAGHGLFGILIAKKNPKAMVVALDWPSVLTVAHENAERFGVSERHSLLAGNALEVPFGEGFHLALVANLLHHWDRTTIHFFLRKVHEALAPGGRVVVVEFAPNDDRVTPPASASFALTMFANTPAGDAYTVSEHLEMLGSAGFSAGEVHALLPSPQTAIIATKQ